MLWIVTKPNSNNTSYEYELHIGEPTPPLLAREIEIVEADGDELAWIFNNMFGQFENTPTRPTCFYGDIARSIFLTWERRFGQSPRSRHGILPNEPE
jgi:hypothetical protein